ncbi:MAG TPA: hypothetical protein VLD65_06405, partial [Anaerolineales bacterium]|nr:hypothetical protein [Anaerolineales bacterium]
MKKQPQFILLIVILPLLLVACASLTGAKGNPTAQPASTPVVQPSITLREAQVTSVEIQVSEAGKSQVNAIVRGNLTESCASLNTPQVNYASGTFQIKLMTQSPNDRGCVQVITPFDQTIPLDVTELGAGSYNVIANGVSAVFTLPEKTSQLGTTVHLVVEAYDRSVRILDASVSLNTTPNTDFNNFLPSGGPALGIAYVIDPTNPEALAIGSNGPQVVEFIQAPATYGLIVWPGSDSVQPRLAWGTEVAGLNQSSTIKVSNLDGTGFETLLTQDSPNPPTQLVPEFWSADGESLYFSKEPLGIGGNILYGGGSSLYKVDLASKAVTELIPLGPDTGPQACLDAISSDYRYVADHCSQTFITVRDLVNGTSSPIQPPAEVSAYYFVGGARFSPSGNHLAYALAMTEQDKEQGWIALTSLNGGSQVVLTSQIGSVYTLAG